MNRTSSRPSRRCSISMAAARVSASKRCRTPLGSPVVPDVNSSWAIASDFGARAAIASGSAFSCSVAVARSRHCMPVRDSRSTCSPAPATSTCSTARPSSSASSDLGLGQVVAPAEALGHDEHARLRAAQRVGHLAAPEDRHERAAHGADAQRRDRQHDELAPVRQLVGDRLARLHAEAQQQRRRPVGGLVQRAPAPRARPVGADVDDRRLRRALACPAAHPLGDRDLGRLVDRDRLDLQLVAGGAALAALGDLHRDPDRRHVVDERGIGDPVRVGVREAARALRARRRDRERHLDAVVVVARQRGAGHAPHARR